MLNTQPFSPAEVKEAKSTTFPIELITAVNQLLVDRYSSSSAGISITLKDIKRRALELITVEHEMTVLEGEEYMADWFDKHYYDFEPLFKKAGWDVYYDRPGYNELYDGFYKFTQKVKD